jgi:hypothetical protein
MHTTNRMIVATGLAILSTFTSLGCRSGTESSRMTSMGSQKEVIEAPGGLQEGYVDDAPEGCVQHQVGDGVTCIDVDTLYQQAEEACTADGAEADAEFFLVDSGYSGCGAEPGSATTLLTFMCCSFEAAFGVPEEVPPAPSAGWEACVQHVGDGVTCIDVDTLNQQAEEVCAADGAEAGAEFFLIESVHTECGAEPGSATILLTFWCCPFEA